VKKATQTGWAIRYEWSDGECGLFCGLEHSRVSAIRRHVRELDHELFNSPMPYGALTPAEKKAWQKHRRNGHSAVRVTMREDSAVTQTDPAKLLARVAELLPCPFCGAGETRFDESTHWTGMRSQILSVTVMHHCAREEGQLQSFLRITGKTEADAIRLWNKRALAGIGDDVLAEAKYEECCYGGPKGLGCGTC
jgi:hypothetical protein